MKKGRGEGRGVGMTPRGLEWGQISQSDCRVCWGIAFTNRSRFPHPRSVHPNLPQGRSPVPLAPPAATVERARRPAGWIDGTMETIVDIV